MQYLTHRITRDSNFDDWAQRLVPISSDPLSVDSLSLQRCSRLEVGPGSSKSYSSPPGSSYRGVHLALMWLLDTMPRKQRPPFAAAVTGSPLFKLAPEVRIMIYELLLIQEGGMFVPSDSFARRDYRRAGATPSECSICGLVFLSDHGRKQHGVKHHGNSLIYSDLLLWPLLPVVSTSLLQTCRIIRLEASPIFYSKNSFHFSDAATASNLRWGSDCAQTTAIQEIGVKFGSSYYGQVASWLTYFTKRTLSLGQDFPHLRRITFSLHAWIGVERSTLLRSMSEGLRQRSQALDWVLVMTFIDEKVLDCFEPLVDKRDDSEHGEKEVRRHVWAIKPGSLWRNGLLWWGSLGETGPRQYRLIKDAPESEYSPNTAMSYLIKRVDST